MAFNRTYWIEETEKEMRYQGILTFDGEEYRIRKYIRDEETPVKFDFVVDGVFDNKGIAITARYIYDPKKRIAESLNSVWAVITPAGDALPYEIYCGETTPSQKFRFDEEVEQVLFGIRNELEAILDIAKSDTESLQTANSKA